MQAQVKTIKETLSHTGNPVSEFTAGVGKAVPVMMGYVPIAIAYGVLAREAGLTLWETVAMSLFVFAGASQFIAVGMFATAVSPFAIIFTTFLVNLRHLLMSASMAPFLKGRKFGTLALLGTGVTDETFAVNYAEFSKASRSHYFMYGVNLASYSSWVTGSLIGGMAGQLVPGLDRLPLDFALPAMFICLLVIMLRNRLMLAMAVLAGALSILLAMWIEGNWNIILATVIAATVGAGWEKCRKQS